ncbi:hypothetical protein BD324DRAFT_654044 [Kockovaella imperatae]|uniref:Uncharacterized protein n=1 Tax=Kockovaella imperatae TaxID=4999 RepID=A0A1Y1U6D1_9TREE|nr:hypothetical protein BD324DRAFT_654044 [Kockovaella imperatae]ORX33589.1 hypothetical protein BD324DRAFT_654044 [Kockovaella imperatae]
MLAAMRKRPRSPSPDTEITSPLDVLLKRRRKRDYFGNIPSDGVEHDSDHHFSDSEGSVLYPRFKEKRRTRQWERQNAPQHSSASGYPFIGQQPYPLRPSLGESRSQPEISSSSSLPTGSHPPTVDQSPLPRWPFSSGPQAESSRIAMSSSPIRHYSPSSSPWRPAIGHSKMNVAKKVAELDTEDFEPMNEDDMRREWGEEYSAQNSLLHSLHKARNTPYTSSLHYGGLSADAADTPDQTILQTPAFASPHAHQYPSYTHSTPSNAIRTAMGPPSSSQTKAWSTPWPIASSTDPTPYRDNALPSSPFTSATLHTTPSTDNADMELDYGPHPRHEMSDSRTRYEEANRLLAELAFDRERRWGDPSKRQ